MGKEWLCRSEFRGKGPWRWRDRIRKATTKKSSIREREIQCRVSQCIVRVAAKERTRIKFYGGERSIVVSWLGALVRVGFKNVYGREINAAAYLIRRSSDVTNVINYLHLLGYAFSFNPELLYFDILQAAVDSFFSKQ